MHTTTIIRAGNLPTNAMVYDFQVTFRPYTFGELKAISLSDISVSDMIDIVASGMYVSGASPLDLTVNDFMFIALLRKLYTLGEAAKYSIDISCAACDKRIMHPLMPESFEFRDLMRKLPATVSLGESKITIKPLTMRMYQKHPDMDALDVLAVCTGLTRMQVYECEHVRDMQNIDKLLDHGLKPIPVECKECGHKHNIDLLLLSENGEASLVYPFIEAIVLMRQVSALSQFYNCSPHGFDAVSYPEVATFEGLITEQNNND